VYNDKLWQLQLEAAWRRASRSGL